MTDPRNPDQFGLSKNEEAEIHGKAVAAHLWEGMEGIFGNMRVGAQSAAYDKLSHRFGAPNVKLEEDGAPYYEVAHGPYAIRYHGGQTMNYFKHGENVSASTTYDHEEMLSDDFRKRLHTWVDEEGQHL